MQQSFIQKPVNIFTGILFIMLICVTTNSLCQRRWERHPLVGSGPKVSVTKPVTAFSSLELDIPLNVKITVVEGAQPSLELYGYENIISNIITKQTGNTLKMYTDLREGWTIKNDSGIRATLIVPSLENISIDGSSSVDIKGVLKSKTFHLDVSGSGALVVESMNVGKFSVEISGSGKVEIKDGTAGFSEYTINGSGKIKAFSLKSSETHANISGSANCEVYAVEKLNLDISGSAKIYYKGHPSMSQNISGAGIVKDEN